MKKVCALQMSLTWLHISDLHVRGGDPYDRDVVFRALVQSVRRFRTVEDLFPDLIFVTGDVAYSGKTDEYAIVSEFLDELLEAAGLDRSRLYVVPGNHDVERIFACQLDRNFTPSGADAYFRPDNPKLHLTHAQGAFLHWHREYFEGIRIMPDNSTCGPVELAPIKNKKLAILPINTALFCRDHLDYERLFVGRRCLDAATTQLRTLGADLRVALMHHPLQYLSEIERQNIRAQLIDNVDVVLCGHLHEGRYAGVDMLSGRNLYCAAGATYQTRERPNRAYYATFNKDRVTIVPIYYVDQPREVWVIDPSVFPDQRGYRASFPVPRGPDFRSFLTSGWDGKFPIPTRSTSRMLGAVAARGRSPRIAPALVMNAETASTGARKQWGKRSAAKKQRSRKK